MKKSYLLLVLCFSFCLSAIGQHQISGKVTESNGDPVSFASVYVKNTKKSVSANADGIYKINVEKGPITLVYRAIGFKTVERLIQVNGDIIENQVLATESYTLQGVTIKPNAEDPAYEIIRQAIKNRKKHLNEVAAFTTDVYIKGLQKLVGAPRKFLGYDIQKTLELDTNRKGILYLSESQSNFSFQRPNKVKEIMVSSKVSGQNNAFSYNKASDMLINFYENLLLEGSGLSSRSFVSPIADNALFYYKYKLLGVTEENGVRINKIELSPRRKNDPAFSGVVYIADDTWRLMGTNVFLTESAGINFVDTLNISQDFNKVENVYLPANMKFQFKGNVFGFKFEGYYVSIYSNYDIHPKFPKNYFTAEILKITKAVNKKDSLYWMNNRPIPLSDEESEDYRRKDSIALLKTTKPYLDSLEKANNKFGIGKFILTGHNFNDRYKKRYIHLDGLLSGVSFNTVEGVHFKYGVIFNKTLEEQRSISIRPQVRYGFSNQIFTANLSGSFLYNRLKRASVSASFGSDIEDLNQYGTMTPRSNAINSLLFETNLVKLYKKEFARITTTRELADGLQAWLTVNYNRNSTLQNTNSYTIRDLENKAYTSNNPFTPNSETQLFPTYRSFNIDATLMYTIGQKYTTTPYAKRYEESRYPRIQLNYRKGFKGILNSDVDYDLVSLEVYQERISTGLFGYMSFVVGAGKFLNNNSVFYPDSKHFRGNSSTVFPPNLRRFRYLDFYQYSTDREYVELHFEHNFAGFLTNKIPLLRKLKLEEIVGVNYLSQPAKRHYKEFHFGVERLGFGISYGYAFDGRKKVEQGFRITYGL
ncbi:MAG: carboxypeptidase-like regulatory domain-containing protein [Pedobacter sp.]|nr:MAG: carboxypeptidase-like regulatory domain-containing protein [Pedobacter sp.]